MGCEQNHICFRESWLAEKMSDLAHHIIKGHIKRVVKDPALAEKLTPNYDLGCKRITPSDTYLQVRLSHYSLHGNISRLVVGLPQILNIFLFTLQAFNKDFVSLITTGIERLTAKVLNYEANFLCFLGTY